MLSPDDLKERRRERGKLLIVPEEPEGETLRVPVLRVFDGDGFLTRLYNPRRGVELEFTVRFGFIDAPKLTNRAAEKPRSSLKVSLGSNGSTSQF